MKRFFVAVACIGVLYISGCKPMGPANDVVIPTATPQNTNTVSVIPSATITPTVRPSNTPIPPTPTIEPPSFLSEFLEGIKVTQFDSFDTDSSLFYNEELVKVQDKKLKMTGLDYSGGAGTDAIFTEGQGIIFDFMIDSAQNESGFEFETYFATGEWWTPGYRRFGVYIAPAPQADMWIGQKGTGKNLTGNLKIVPDTTYQVMLSVGNDANFLCIIWDPNNLDKYRIYRIPKGGDWSNLTWSFNINGAKGGMFVDNFTVFSFDGYK
jgi:hypothetical protein